MKIFLDTANLDEIQQASDFGLLDGITTNPTLAAREGRPFRELILKACEIVKDGVVNAEVVSTDTDGMLREGRELASWHSNIVESARRGGRSPRAARRGYQDQCNVGFFRGASASRGESRSLFRQPFPRTIGRYGAGRTSCAQ